MDTGVIALKWIALIGGGFVLLMFILTCLGCVLSRPVNPNFKTVSKRDKTRKEIFDEEFEGMLDRLRSMGDRFSYVQFRCFSLHERRDDYSLNTGRGRGLLEIRYYEDYVDYTAEKGAKIKSELQELKKFCNNDLKSFCNRYDIALTVQKRQGHDEVFGFSIHPRMKTRGYQSLDY